MIHAIEGSNSAGSATFFCAAAAMDDTLVLFEIYRIGNGCKTSNARAFNARGVQVSPYMLDRAGKAERS